MKKFIITALAVVALCGIAVPVQANGYPVPNRFFRARVFAPRAFVPFAPALAYSSFGYGAGYGAYGAAFAPSYGLSSCYGAVAAYAPSCCGAVALAPAYAPQVQAAPVAAPCASAGYVAAPVAAPVEAQAYQAQAAVAAPVFAPSYAPAFAPAFAPAYGYGIAYRSRVLAVRRQFAGFHVGGKVFLPGVAVRAPVARALGFAGRVTAAALAPRVFAPRAIVAPPRVFAPARPFGGRVVAVRPAPLRGPGPAVRVNVNRRR